MIPTEQLVKRASMLRNSIGRATVTINGEALDGVVKKITLEGQTIKVFVSLTGVNGNITQIDIYDTDGDLLQTQSVDITKQDHYTFMAVVEISVEGVSY